MSRPYESSGVSRVRVLQTKAGLVKYKRIPDYLEGLISSDPLTPQGPRVQISPDYTQLKETWPKVWFAPTPGKLWIYDSGKAGVSQIL